MGYSLLDPLMEIVDEPNFEHKSHLHVVSKPVVPLLELKNSEVTLELNFLG